MRKMCSFARNHWALLAFIVVYTVAIFVVGVNFVKADTPSITIQEINYNNSTITLKANASDTIIYFSDKTGKTWEAVPGELSTNKLITMDISWISMASNYTLRFKGDASTSIATVIIPKQVTNFKAKYNKVKSEVTFTNQSSRTIQWRKKDSYIWNTLNTSTFTEEMEMLCTQGATLYLRLAPTNGTVSNGVFNPGYRPSKEVTLTIPKKTTAPSINIDGSRFLIAAAKNIAYRTVKADGTMTEWTTLSSPTNLLLRDIAGNALYTNKETTQAEVTLQFRKNATSSTQVSHITTITVPIQESEPSEEENGISVDYTSAKSLSLTIKAASSTKPFEYTVVENGEEIDYLTASWTAITSSSAVSISKTTAPEGSKIYVRKKTISANGDVEFALASKEVNITGSNGITYPNAATADRLTTLISTAGVCTTDNTTGHLSFTLYSPTKTTVSKVNFNDQYGNLKGSVSIKSTVANNASATGKSDKYIITTKITSTESLSNITETNLYADITFANGDTFTSTTSNGILLYLYPATKLNNTENDDYIKDFQRILYSTEANDDKSFTFRLDFGKAKVADTTSIDSFKAEDVVISSMKYDGYSLVAGSDYTVVYGTDTNSDGETIRIGTVTVNISNFENNATITTKGSAVNLFIQLNNGEHLNRLVSIKLIETATLQETPIAWSIMEGSLKEKVASTVTNDDNTTTTVETEVVTYELNLELFSKTYEVGVSDVTWGGISILKSATVSDGKAIISLSNPKINRLTTSSTTTNNIVITLSNGYVISSGCKLTIVSSVN